MFIEVGEEFMQEIFPIFRYHPDPISTGAIQASDEVCGCCKRARGYVYRGGVYAQHDDEILLCPWCIADGNAAAKFHGSFNQVDSLIEHGVPASVVRELSERTPGYSSWQELVWLHHCSDACEFHGDATAEDVRNASADTFEAFMEDQEENRAHWISVFRDYEPNEDLVFYRYVCRHCQAVRLMYEYS